MTGILRLLAVLNLECTKTSANKIKSWDAVTIQSYRYLWQSRDGMRSCPIGLWRCHNDGFWFMMAWQWWVIESNYDEERQIWWRFWIFWRMILWPSIDRCQDEIFGLNLALRAASANAQWPNVPCREETLQIVKVIAVPCVTVRFLLEKLPCMFKP